MRILVTNDDGVDSPGIHALAAALVADGHDVFVVAPTDDRSGAGASIGRMMNAGPPPVERHVWDDLPDLPVHAIDAPPAMAVFATCLGAFGNLPDVIASGINPGANTGHLVLHSGTVGAALTGAGYGIPGIAVSMDWNVVKEYHWDVAARMAASAVEWVAKPDGNTRVLNLNVPNLPLAELKGVRESELAPAGEVWVASADVSEGDLKIEITGRADSAPGTDVSYVKNGYVSVTPLMSIVRGPARGAAEAIVETLDLDSLR
ncbi:MAG TPA: 5'/3'-nucleotidase SurE [Acidimicrobiia bacterium]|nr:5'/3'-nucleotidase SurE [Acidimicrobiia bacterium]